MEGVECAYIGRERMFAYGRFKCAYMERGCVHMEGIKCACMVRGRVCIWKGWSVHREREDVCIWKGWSVRVWGEGGCVHMEGLSVRTWRRDVCIWKGSSVHAWGRGCVHMEGSSACMGRGCVYGRVWVCMHGEWESVYMEGVECACTERGTVCIWKESSVHACGRGSVCVYRSV